MLNIAMIFGEISEVFLERWLRSLDEITQSVIEDITMITRQRWQLAFVGGEILSVGVEISLGTIGSSIMVGLSAITPSGWAVIGATVIVGAITVGIKYARIKSQIKSKQEVDPYARSGQKKRSREIKNKSRRNSNFKSRDNKRNKKIRTAKETYTRERTSKVWF